MKDCLFCTIANGPSDKLVWQDDRAAAFKDIHPKAPTHLLVVPKVHVASLSALADADLAGHLLMAVKAAALAAGLEHYRVVINNGAPAGQVIEHLHLHILGGQPLQDYPH